MKTDDARKVLERGPRWCDDFGEGMADIADAPEIIHALTDALRAALADVERLDWLASQSWFEVWVHTECDLDSSTAQATRGTLRDAIDAARAKMREES